MSFNSDSDLKLQLEQLECHFTWPLNKEDTDLTNLLKRLEQQTQEKLGRKACVVRCYSFLGFVKFLLGLNDEALICFQKSVEITKESHKNEDDKLYIVAYGNLAWLHYHMEAYTECESYLTKVQKIKDKYSHGSPTAAAFANVIGEKGWTFFKFSYKYYDRAEECIRKALELEPEQPELNADLAILLYRKETEFIGLKDSPAIKQLRRAIEIKPDDDDVLKVLLGLKLIEFNKEDSEAENLIEIALERSSEHPYVIRYVGKFLRIKGSVKRSIALLKRALEKNPDSAFIHHQLALCYKNQIIELYQLETHKNKIPEIIHIRNQCIYHLEKATTLDTTFIKAMSDLALQYGQNRDVLKSLEMFNVTFKTAEENLDQQLVLGKFAEFHQHTMKCESLAVKLYTKCAKMNPSTHEGRIATKNLQKINNKKKHHSEGEVLELLQFMNKVKGNNVHDIESCEKAIKVMDNDEYLSYLCELRLSLQ